MFTPADAQNVTTALNAMLVDNGLTNESIRHATETIQVPLPFICQSGLFLLPVCICKFQSMKGIHVIDKYSAKRYLSYFLIHIWAAH